MPSDDILNGGGYQQILLLQTKLLSSVSGIVGIEDTGDVFCPLSGLKGIVIFSSIEGEEVEFIEGQRFPETETDGVECGIAGDGSIICSSNNCLRILPIAPLYAFGIGGPSDLTVKFDLVFHINSLDLPRVAVAEPIIRYFYLISILDQLLENAVVIANAVSPGRIVQRRHRIQKTGSQSPQATIS